MIVLDTHTLIWWVSDPGKLSKKALAQINKAGELRELLVSSISVWEIYMLVKKGRVKLNVEVGEWVRMVEQLPIRFVPVDNTVAYLAVNLKEFEHQDPADRIIIATALNENAVLVTKDEKIRSYKLVKTVW